MDVAEKLTINLIREDTESHITIDQDKCKKCEARPCLFICPAKLYEKSEDTGEIKAEHAGCLECGTCMITCPEAALTWTYPRGGFGVQYRYG
jgi:ferredoxin like protein